MNSFQFDSCDLILQFGSSLSVSNPRDIDLLIISDRFSSINFSQRIQSMGLPKGYDLFCYTLDEFLKLYPINHPFRLSILRNNKVLMGNLNVISRE